MTRTLILGGGFGGITVATELRRQLADDAHDHEIVLLDRAEHFTMGLRKLWQLVGLGTLEEGRRSRTQLDTHGIRFVQAEILGIDPRQRRAVTPTETFDADHLVVALGAEARPDLIPGLLEHGHDVWTVAAIPKLQEALARLGTRTDRPERVVISITGVPYTCPPAPYECAMLLDAHLRKRGVRERVEIRVTTLQPILLPNAGNAGSDWLAERLTERSIAFQTGVQVKQVHAGRLEFENGAAEFDLLIGVPPHRTSSVVRSSGLTGDAEWIAVDPRTLETPVPRVYAIGDVVSIKLANGLGLPKAGLMAERQGLRVAAAIAADLRGDPAPAAFDGNGFCFMETGLETAALIEGKFFATPQPEVELRDESESHAQAKHAFESERLARWFGG